MSLVAQDVGIEKEMTREGVDRGVGGSGVETTPKLRRETVERGETMRGDQREQRRDFEKSSPEETESESHKRRNCTSFRLLLRRQLWVGTVRMAASLGKFFRSRHSSHGVRKKRPDRNAADENEETQESPTHVPTSPPARRLFPLSPRMEDKVGPSDLVIGAASLSPRVPSRAPASISSSPSSSPTKSSTNSLNGFFKKSAAVSPPAASLPAEPNSKHMKAVRSRRLLKEFHELTKVQMATKDPIFTVDLVSDCLYEWKVKLHRIDPESELSRDMVEFNIPYILLNMSFPEAFPFQPPFLRVLAPRLEKGFVMEGGAICMELLTPRGWASAYTIEAVVMQFAASLVKGQGRISRKHKNPKEFNKRSAEASFRSLVKTHDKYGWVTPPLSEG